jgi:hypothetical protein
MRAYPTIFTLAAVLVASLAGTAGPALADDPVDTGFARRMFRGNVDKTKSYACFVRRYDAAHLKEHPLQKVSVMKLLITAEWMPEDKTLSYSFRLGVNFRSRPGDFDSSGECLHLTGADAHDQAGDLGCSVDCDGGGISVDLAKDDASVIVKLDQIRIWKGKNYDQDAATELKGGADDKEFRLVRAELDDCASLVTDRKELARMRHK